MSERERERDRDLRILFAVADQDFLDRQTLAPIANQMGTAHVGLPVLLWLDEQEANT